MFLIPFLNQRQIGTKSQCGFRALNHRLNLDNLLSRFVCYQNDAITVHGEESDVPPFACKFRRDTESDLLAVANEDGDILLYNTLDGLSKSFVKSFPAHRNAIFDICWLPHQCHLLTASGDHHASLWDISTCSFITKFKAHSASVKSVDVCLSQSAIFATGSRDGNIYIWDTRDQSIAPWHKPAISIVNAHSRKSVSGKKNTIHSKDVTGSVSCVAFQDYNTLASGGVADGVVKIWDLRKTYVSKNKSSPLPRNQMKYCGEKSAQHGCTSLVFDSASKKLYACSTGNEIYQFDCHTYSDNAVVYKGFKCDTYFVKMALSFNDEYLLCGSSDHKAYIWKTTKPGLPIFELSGHIAEVTSVAWTPYTVTKLVTCGDDYKVLVWKIGSDENQERNEIIYSCSQYSEGSGQVSLFRSNIEVLDYQQSVISERRLSLPTPQVLNKPMMKVITNFFSPSVTSHSVNSQQNSLTSQNQKRNSDGSKLDQHNFSVSSKDSVPSTSGQNSSFSKILSDTKNILETTPCKETNFDSVVKKAETAPPILCSRVQNKENKNTHERTNVNGQTKRKLLLHQSTPKFRRCTSGSKEKDSNKVKKQFTPGRTILNYFSVDLSPEN